MQRGRLDDVDRRILGCLQRNARRKATEIAEEVPVSANTVRNRIEALEEAGIIRGYRIAVDYSLTGFPLYYLFVCTTSIADREALAGRALEVPGVVGIDELMTGQRNLGIKVVGRDQDAITDIARALDGLGIEVVDETLIKRDYDRSLSWFETANGTA